MKHFDAMGVTDLLIAQSFLLFFLPSAMAFTFTRSLNPSRQDYNWRQNATSTTNITSPPYQIDPNDPSAICAYSGRCYADGQFDQKDMVLTDSLQYVIPFNCTSIDHSECDYNWQSVEMVTSIFVEAAGTMNSLRNGPNLVGPTNHGLPRDDPCDAGGYYLFISSETGDLCMGKRYTKGVEGKRLCYPLFENGLPVDNWVGLKFAVATVEDRVDAIQLVAQVKNSGSAATWSSVATVLDETGKWNATNAIPQECASSVTDGQTFFGGKYIQWQTQGARVRFRGMKGNNILPLSSALATTVPTAAPTLLFPTFMPSTLSRPETSDVPSAAPSSTPSDLGETIFEISLPKMSTNISDNLETAIQFQYVVSQPNFEIHLFEQFCTGDRVDQYFNITSSISSRNDGLFDLVATLVALPQIKGIDSLYNDDNPALIQYMGCTRVKLKFDDDNNSSTSMIPMYFSDQPFHITVDTVAGEATILEADGKDQNDILSDSVSGDYSYNMFQCDRNRDAITSAITMADMVYICMEPESLRSRITSLQDCGFELLSNEEPIEAYAVIKNSTKVSLFTQVTRPAPDSSVWLLGTKLPASFFEKDGNLKLTCNVTSEWVGQDRHLESLFSSTDALSNEDTQPKQSAIELDSIVLQKTRRGLIEWGFQASFSVQGVELPGGYKFEEASFLDLEEVLDYGAQIVCPDGAFCITRSIKNDDHSFLRSNLHRLLRNDAVLRVEISIYDWVMCSDGSCSNSQELLHKRSYALIEDLQTSTVDASLTAAIQTGAEILETSVLRRAEVVSESFGHTTINFDIVEMATAPSSSANTAVLFLTPAAVAVVISLVLTGV